MKGGDLDSRPPARDLYVVWENFLAQPGPRHTPERFTRRLRWRNYRHALALYETNPAAVQALWDLWQDDQPVAVLTFLPPDMEGLLRRRLDAEDIPHSHLVRHERLALARSVAQLDGVAQIVHGEPADALLYGPKGRYIPPHTPQLIRKGL